ncbi:MAG TPA: homoserine dehydrogenase [Longimicrobiaceae bacterium]|nr:homoserine dehydrogenase [Longimicrobiaceae bacterium]
MEQMLYSRNEEGRSAGRAPRIRTVRVALAGCGVVGSELLRLLDAQAEAIERERGLRFEVVRVLVRHPSRERAVPLGRERFSGDLEEFLAADSDLVVEAMGGVEPALQIAEATLRAGRDFVTANKALVAAHGPTLNRLAHRHGVRLDFESAVGGGIPVVRALRDSLRGSGVTRLRGILNGTCNYVLTRLAEGESYAAALADAQERGFAEADPTRDVDGQDAADKIAVLAWLAFGAEPDRLPIRCRGIVPDPDRLASDARSVEGVVRLVAECLRLGDGVAASVEPVIVAPDSELARTRGEQNAVLLDTRWNGVIRLAGPGAGGGPTASVLLADMLRGAAPIPEAAPATAAGVPDTRHHRWLVSVLPATAAEQRLDDALLRAGIDAGKLRRFDDAVRAVTPPAAWSQVAGVERELAAAGLRPLITRAEL